MEYSDSQFQAFNSSSRKPISSQSRSNQARDENAELCKRFLGGKCKRGVNCLYIHDNGAKLRLDGADSITLGNDTRRAKCRRTSHCMLLWKTRLCSYWEKDGTCRDGGNCNFAHGEAELRKQGYAHTDQESGKAISVETQANSAKGPVSGNQANVAKGPVSGKTDYKVTYEQPVNRRKRYWWNSVKQVNKIYADWIDIKEEAHPRGTSGNQE